MAFCTCNGTLKNTGVPTKQRVIRDGVKLILVPLRADDGTLNAVALTDTLDAAFFEGKVNEPDATKRWYPVGEFKNVEDTRADTVFETFSDGSQAITQQGLRTFTGWLINYAAAYLENLKSFTCVKFGVYVVDDCGGLIGSISSDGTLLKPIQVNEAAFNPTYVKASDTAVAKVQLNFEFSQLERDEKLRVISSSEMDYDLLSIEGLIELKAAFSAEATSGFVAELAIDYDEFISKIPVEGWVMADFVLFNETTQTAITVTSVTEAPAGTYTFVIPAQSSADELRLTNDPSAKAGFSLNEVVSIP